MPVVLTARVFEFMTDDIVDIIAREAVDKTAILFKAVKPKGGEMPVVMGGWRFGYLVARSHRTCF